MSHRMLELHISPAGNDNWTGRYASATVDGSDGPLASLEQARDRLRAAKAGAGLSETGAIIHMHPGIYERTTSFVLEQQDSGTCDAPIIYRAVQPGKAVLLGGRQLEGWAPVSDPRILERLTPSARGYVQQVSLFDLGITDLGEMRLTDHPTLRHAHLELFYDGQRMQLSRWPNEDWLRITALPEASPKLIGDQPHLPPIRAVDGFCYEGERPGHWADTSDLWAHGYWTWDWSDSHEKVASIDTQKGEVCTVGPHHRYGFTPGQHFYFENILEELDTPGQWYLDRSTGTLYFWPPETIGGHEISVSMLSEPIIRLSECEHIRIEGLLIEGSRGNGCEIEGGKSITLSGCIIRNLGNSGVLIQGGTAHKLENCELAYLGESAIQLEGGDRATLKPGSHSIVNCHIHHYGRWTHCGTYGVMMSGVGHSIAHCHIHDAPFEGIYLKGNDHIIEYNEMDHLGLGTGDVGAIHTGRDWTWRGNMVRYNCFHDLGGINLGCQAVYLDDWMSGVLIYGNVFYKTKFAAFIGGGHDNSVINNIFVDCDHDVHMDQRGITWAAYYFDGTYPILFETLEAMRYTEPPYCGRYPELQHVLDGNPAVPHNNLVARNIHWGDGVWADLPDGCDDSMCRFECNLLEHDPEFVNAASGNLSLKASSPAWALGFQPIPLDQIGLQPVVRKE